MRRASSLISLIFVLAMLTSALAAAEHVGPCGGSETGSSPPELLIDACSAFLEKPGTPVGPRVHALVTRAAARMLIDATQKPVEILADLDQAIRLDPTYWPAYTDRGSFWLKQKDYARAIADLDKAIELRPDATVNYELRGDVHSAQGHFRDAIQDYTNGLHFRPGDYHCLLGRGSAFIAIHDYHSAMTDLNGAIGAEPTLPAAFRLRASAYREMGDPDHAETDEAEANRLGARPSN
jgi:tetratricopeptide (TPR) repeat protein